MAANNQQQWQNELFEAKSRDLRSSENDDTKPENIEDIKKGIDQAERQLLSTLDRKASIEEIQKDYMELVRAMLLKCSHDILILESLHQNDDSVLEQERERVAGRYRKAIVGVAANIDDRLDLKTSVPSKED